MQLASKPHKITGLDGLSELIASDFRSVNELIQTSLRSEVVLIDQLSQYIISSGGKRLRPILVLLSAKANDYSGTQHINLAAIIEFIHTATLLHDDVVDASDLRRGQSTANAIWGNEASVLVGDFLYSRAFQMMVDVQDMRVMKILSDATNTIAEGEVMQLLLSHDPDTQEAQYLQVISSKTAKLFEAGCQLGAVVAGTTADRELAMAHYGRHLGIAFQLVDDVLDYSGTPETIGKNTGDDLAEGKPTLPLIYAMNKGNAQQTALIRQAIKEGGLTHIDEVTQIVQTTGALDYTLRFAEQHCEQALNAIHSLPESAYKEALKAIARFSVERSF